MQDVLVELRRRYSAVDAKMFALRATPVTVERRAQNRAHDPAMADIKAFLRHNTPGFELGCTKFWQLLTRSTRYHERSEFRSC